MVIETKAEVDLNAQPKQPTEAEMAEKKERDKKYPLVLFIHDAGVASNGVKQPLYQGNGASQWAACRP